MEIFGVWICFLVAFALSLFVPGLLYKCFEKRVFARLVTVLLANVWAVSIVAELTLIQRFGLVVAHDRFYPLLDRLQGFNMIFGPLILTSIAVLWLRSINFKIKTVKWCAGFVCFCAFGASALTSLFYDAETHYRTDSEGTYRIEEK